MRASEIPVLAFEEQPEQSYDTLSAEIEASMQQDDCQSIVLGCAGMADMASRLSQQHRIPVIDGVRAAVGLAEMLHKTFQP